MYAGCFSYANVGGRMDSESVQSVLQTHTVKGTIVMKQENR